MSLKENIIKVLIAFIPLIQLLSCAQQGSPTGGPKDVIPPKILSSVPENYSSNFKGTTITLTFDEYVQLKDVSNQLLISPPLKEKPQLRLKGKSVIIDLKEELKDSTTYYFHFGESIVDLNEGNILDSNLFIFSTGDFLDSLELTGNIKNTIDGSTEKGVYVMLYKNLEDSVPYKEIPYYVTRTKADGNYILRNLKGGVYRLFALKDLNNNMLFDQPEELIGFADSIISLDSNLVVNLNLFEEENKKQFLKKTNKEQYGKYNFIFNLPVDSIEISPLNIVYDKPWYIEERGVKGDSISYWFTDIEGMDTLELLVKDFNTIEDTVYLRIGKKEKESPKLAKGGKISSPLLLEHTFNASIAMGLHPEKPLQIKFSHPVKEYDFSNVFLTKGDDTLAFEHSILDSSLSKTFGIFYKWEEDSVYKLTAPDSIFTDIFDLANDSIMVDFKVRKKDSYGSLSLTLEVPEKGHQFILQFCKDKQNVIEERILSHNDTVYFEDIDPGSYVLKIIYDENNNGKWDTGNFMEKKQPEKIIYYSGDILVRPDWDMELEWDLEGKKVPLEETEAESIEPAGNEKGQE